MKRSGQGMKMSEKKVKRNEEMTYSLNRVHEAEHKTEIFLSVILVCVLVIVGWSVRERHSGFTIPLPCLIIN